MKVAVLGATGKEGQLLLAEAKRRGMDVTAIVRNASKITDGTPTIEKRCLSINNRRYSSV